MRFLKPLLVCLALLAAVFASAQVQPSKPTSSEMVRDVAKLITQHWPTKEQLRSSADQLARKYSVQIGNVSKKVTAVETDVKTKFDAMDWHQKMNLALEMWRVRSSLDLLQLCTPEVFENMSGMPFPDLRGLVVRLQNAEAQLADALPFWGHRS